MKQLKNIKTRTAMYFIGLFVMTIGIALSVKSNLGVSPVSSIPYTMTCVWGIEMGKATILFHIVLVLASTVFVAAGIFLYLPADLIPLAGEGAMQAVSSVTKIEFSKVKIGFDCTMVLISVITCLVCLHNLGSVGVGTIIAAFLVGTLVGVINRAFGKKRDELLGKNDEADVSGVTEQKDCYVITISREFGSGGREIGKILAKQLGFRYYDSELIRLAAEKSGYSPEYIEQNEQAIKNPVLHDFFAWYAGPLEQSELPKVDQLSEKMAEAKVKKVDHERAVHCRHFTKTEWGNIKNYDLCIKSNDFGIEETAQIIQGLFQRKITD